MIPKNLKIGDTFEDCGSTYEIIRVLKDGNYISKRVECKKLVEKDELLEEKAENKKTMIPYLVGAILIFASTTIVNVVYNIANSFNG